MRPGDRRLQDQRPAGADQAEGRRQAGGRAGAVGDDVEGAGEPRGVVEMVGRDPLAGQGEFRGMLADQRDRGPECRAAQAQSSPSLPSPTTAIATSGPRATCSATRKAAARGSMKTASRVVDGVGDRVQVPARDADAVGHRAVVAQDAQDGPVRAVAGQARAAGRAGVAGVVDLGRVLGGRRRRPRRTRARGRPGSPCSRGPVASRCRRCRRPRTRRATSSGPGSGPGRSRRREAEEPSQKTPIIGSRPSGGRRGAIGPFGEISGRMGWPGCHSIIHS